MHKHRDIWKEIYGFAVFCRLFGINNFQERISEILH